MLHCLHLVQTFPLLLAQARKREARSLWQEALPLLPVALEAAFFCLLGSLLETALPVIFPLSLGQRQLPQGRFFCPRAARWLETLARLPLAQVMQHWDQAAV